MAFSAGAMSQQPARAELSPPARQAAIGQMALLLGCLTVGCLASVGLGQDANWDLLNYHLYNGAALLQGRFQRDLLPAGMQSYLNPLLDAVYAGLALGPLHRHPRWLAAFMGLWFGAGLFLATKLAVLLYANRLAPALAGVLLAVTGSAMVSQIGTTTDEIPVGVIMLGGLYTLLRREPSARSIVASGLLFGLAAGLKLTAVAYAPAACLAAASLHRPGRMIAACATFSASWVVGLALSDGWWAWQLYDRFASPTFPLFNGVFRSPWYPPASVIDHRFIPRGLLQWLFYPLYWLGTPGVMPGEQTFRDPRGAVVLCLAMLAVPAWPLRRLYRAAALTPAQRAALVFLAVGYVTWLATSSILRYAVVIEVVAGLVVPLLLLRVLSGRVGLAALAGVLVATLAITRYPQSARIPYGAATLQADMGWVEPGMLIVVTFRGPSAHVLAMMPHQREVAAMNVGDTVLEARGWTLHDEMVRRIADHDGPIIVVTQGDMQGGFPELNEIGLAPTLTHCRPVGSTLVPTSATGIHACDAQKMGPRHLASPFWAQAAQHYRTILQPADASQSLIGAAYLQAVGPVARGTRFLDWTDLLWSGVGTPPRLPARPDPGTLYVLGPEHVRAMAGIIDPAADALGRVDGVIVAAPGWRRCTSCTAPIEPIEIADPGAPLAIGDVALLNQGAAASPYLRGGWWPGNAAESWSQEQADMAIPLSAGLPATATLLLTGIGFTGPGLPTQRVIVSVQGAPAPEPPQSVAGQGAIRVPIRRAWLEPRPDGGFMLQLHLEFPDANSPYRLGMSLDPRRLGFAPATASLEQP